METLPLVYYVVRTAFQCAFAALELLALLALTAALAGLAYKLFTGEKV